MLNLATLKNFSNVRNACTRLQMLCFLLQVLVSMLARKICIKNSLPFFNADSKPGKSHRFIVCSSDFNHTLSYLSSVYCRITSVTTLWSSYSTCSTRKKLSERSLFAADCQPTNVIFGNSFHSHWFVVVAEHSNFLFKFRYPRSCTPPLDLLR